MCDKIEVGLSNEHLDPQTENHTFGITNSSADSYERH